MDFTRNMKYSGSECLITYYIICWLNDKCDYRELDNVAEWLVYFIISRLDGLSLDAPEVQRKLSVTTSAFSFSLAHSSSFSSEGQQQRGFSNEGQQQRGFSSEASAARLQQRGSTAARLQQRGFSSEASAASEICWKVRSSIVAFVHSYTETYFLWITISLLRRHDL